MKSAHVWTPFHLATAFVSASEKCGTEIHLPRTYEFLPSGSLRRFRPSWKPRISHFASNGTPSVVQPSAELGIPPSKDLDGR